MPPAGTRLRTATRVVLQALVAAPTANHHGTDLLTATGLVSGSLYPELARLEAIGWLDSGWEDPLERIDGWPRRRYYRLTPGGLAAAGSALRVAPASSAAPARLRPAVST